MNDGIVNYSFSAEKNAHLKLTRDISFEEIVVALNNNKVLDIVDYHNQKKYPHQKIYYVEVKEYVYMVPFVRQENNRIFLKTIFASREATKNFFGKGEQNEN